MKCTYCKHRAEEHTGYTKKREHGCDVPGCNCNIYQEKRT